MAFITATSEELPIFYHTKACHHFLWGKEVLTTLLHRGEAPGKCQLNKLFNFMYETVSDKATISNGHLSLPGEWFHVSKG